MAFTTDESSYTNWQCLHVSRAVRKHEEEEDEDIQRETEAAAHFKGCVSSSAEQ